MDIITEYSKYNSFWFLTFLNALIINTKKLTIMPVTIENPTNPCETSKSKNILWKAANWFFATNELGRTSFE